MKLTKTALTTALFFFVISFSLPCAADDNRIVETAKKVGIVKCLPAIKHLSNHVVDDGSTSGYNAVWSIEEPDKSFYNVTMERTYDDGNIFADLIVSPTPKGECSAVLSKMFYMGKSCLAASKDPLFEKAKYKRELHKDVAYFTDGGQDIYFIPVGTGCMIVTKQAFLDANKLAETEAAAKPEDKK